MKYVLYFLQKIEQFYGINNTKLSGNQKPKAPNFQDFNIGLNQINSNYNNKDNNDLNDNDLDI